MSEIDKWCLKWRVKKEKIQHIRRVNSYLTLKKIEIGSRINEEWASSVSGYMYTTVCSLSRSEKTEKCIDNFNICYIKFIDS